MGKKIWHRKRILMEIDRDMDHNRNIEVRALVSWNVGNVVRNTFGEIIHRITVVFIRYIVCKRSILLGMLGRLFLLFM